MRRYTITASKIWAPGSPYCDLPGEDQLTIHKLSSQGDISAAGVLPLVPGRWAAQSHGMGVDELEASLRRLVDRRWIIIDEQTQEVLIKTFIEDDGGWTNSKRRVAICAAASSVASPVIRRALATICARLGIPLGSTATATAIATAVSVDDPDPDQTAQVTGAWAPVATGPDAPSDRASDAPSDRGRVVVSQGLYLVPALHTPHSPPLRHADAPPDHDPEEGGGPSEPETGRLLAEAALADEIRSIRPIWSTKSVRRALRHPDVRERPLDVVAAAMRLIAADIRSTAPGRLRHDGDWWARAERQIGSSPAASDARPVPAWRTEAEAAERLDATHRADRANRGRAKVDAAIAAAVRPASSTSSAS